MRYDGQYINVKRMGLALDGLIRSEYPGDFLQFIEMYTFAKPRHISRGRRADAQAGDDLRSGGASLRGHERSEHQRDADPAALHQHPAWPAARPASSWRPRTRPIGRSCSSPTVCRRPISRARSCTCSIRPIRAPKRRRLREAQLCARKGSRSISSCCRAGTRSEEDVQFAYRLAESTKGRVFFTAGRDLDRYVVWDYVARRKQILG